MPSYAIVGASRGIGLEYVRQLAGRPDTVVFPIVRNSVSSTYLQSFVSENTNVHILEADVGDAANALSEITGGSLDCLIHNAARVDPDAVFKGYDAYETVAEMDDDLIVSFKINALGFIHAVKAFLPLIRAASSGGKTIVSINSAGAAPNFIRGVGIGHMVGYGMSKAALLVATTKWAVDLAPEHFTVVSLSPGLVDISETAGDSEEASKFVREEGEKYVQAGFPDMGAQTVEQSVAAQLKVIDGLSVEDTGKFFAHTGNEFQM
ncbi:NAD(P)-binding protein [Epithele typhae]|uniref:NAD(P)-binding protein n=1 Tax=Epithele typhae TaxID=378194 RepID=UPI0020082FFF|nr:NAD(P)-binding protein [Epithele typhae]KAH9916606.1 NAD(P)-binding protein [Epithele typhae]